MKNLFLTAALLAAGAAQAYPTITPFKAPTVAQAEAAGGIVGATGWVQEYCLNPLICMGLLAVAAAFCLGHLLA